MIGTLVAIIVVYILLVYVLFELESVYLVKKLDKENWSENEFNEIIFNRFLFLGVLNRVYKTYENVPRDKYLRPQFHIAFIFFAVALNLLIITGIFQKTSGSPLVNLIYLAATAVFLYTSYRTFRFKVYLDSHSKPPTESHDKRIKSR